MVNCIVTSPPYYALRDYDYYGVVLDCFMGAGTTALVAKELDRNYIEIEPNPEYIKLAEEILKNKMYFCEKFQNQFFRLYIS